MKNQWFPITSTMRYLSENGSLNDDILQIGVRNKHSDKIRGLYHKTINLQRQCMVSVYLQTTDLWSQIYGCLT